MKEWGGFRRLRWPDRLRLLLGARLELCITIHRRIAGGEVAARVNLVDRWATTLVCSVGTSSLGLIEPEPEHDSVSYQ